MLNLLDIKVSPITIMLSLVFLYPILKGFLFKFSSESLKEDITDTNKNISFIIALITGINFSKKTFILHEEGIYKTLYNWLPDFSQSYIEANTFIVYLIIFPIVILIFYKIINMLFELLSRVTFYPIIDGVAEYLKTKGNFAKRIFGMAFETPKAICYLILAVFLLNLASILNVNAKLNKYLENSKPYSYICKEFVIPISNSQIAKQLPSVINNSFKVVEKDQDAKDINNKGNNNKGRTIVYYNGVTLEEGVKSNSEIDRKARQIVERESSTKGKAKAIYTWVGSNISYDNEKANRVMNNDFNVKSGAIPTFNTKQGICFDYSCVFVAMCRANGIKVRLVTGEGFNGVSWVSHAWNQVYIPEEGKWINVDTTFFKGGNYFNSKRFDIDHKESQVAGEW